MPTISTSTTAQEVFPENKLRKSFIMQNTDGTINMFLRRGSQGEVTSTDFDHRLGPNGTLALNDLQDGKAQIQIDWRVIAASGTPVIAFFETESIER